VPLVYPLAALGVATLGALAVHYVTEAFERERTRELFARFVPEAVVGQALAQSDGARLGGVSREVTVMFSDLRGFHELRRVAGAGRRDHDPQPLPHGDGGRRHPVQRRHAGRLHGRRIMAVFGAPIEMDDHAEARSPPPGTSSRELERFNAWLRTSTGSTSGSGWASV
jgi:adenylate cyclase